MGSSENGKAADENDSDLSTVGDAAVIVSTTFPGGSLSNGSSAVCRISAWKVSQLRLQATFCTVDRLATESVDRKQDYLTINGSGSACQKRINIL